MYSFDYYEPRRQPVRRIFLANQGWFPVPAEEMLTLSAYLRADAESVAAQLLVCEAPDQYQRRKVVVGRDWQRRGFTFKSRGRFLFVAVGLDWEATGGESATLWVDAVQLERGGQITPYAPSQPLEAFAEVEAPGHITTNVAEGLRIRMRAFNDQDQARTLRGALKLEDFFGEAVYERPVVMHVPAREGASMDFARLSRNRRGFFWAHWSAGPTTQRLRCAVIDPPAPNTSDAFFGFNHAYPWDFLVELAGQAGVRWWRDWSAKWQTVEPQPGRFDFTAADAQIHRVLGLGGQVDVLLPFPAAAWSTTARAAEVSQAAGTDAYLRQRLPLAYAPRELNQFGRYAAEVVRHYRQGPRGGVSTFQVLNEPVYTTYALPSQFGYRLEDYLRLLRTAYAAMKAADSQCQIIGGPGAGPEADLTRDFILQGGLDSVDVLDVHLYDPPRPAENYERVFGAVGQWMRGHGGPKPIWITEWGCYADDDPACLPQAVGDQTMNRCRWPSERAATEHLVKFVAVGLANGVRKLFWHAGVCGAINGPDAGGVLFEYGGTPRKMYAGVATLNRLLALPGECLGRVDRPPVKAYLFRVSGDTVAVAWTSAGQQRWVDLGPGVIAIDLMGNRLAGSALTLTETPVYLLSRHWREVLEGLGGAQAN